jgi:hypothetical protein
MIRQNAGLLTCLPLPATLALAAVLVSACGSSARPATAATAKTCQQISVTLGDGPDPDSDPVGHAEAQFRPLRQIHAPDRALQGAIRQLDNAYSSLFASNGASSAAKEAVVVASKRINSLCPGAAS